MSIAIFNNCHSHFLNIFEEVIINPSHSTPGYTRVRNLSVNSTPEYIRFKRWEKRETL